MTHVIRERAIKKHEQDLANSELLTDDEFERNDDLVKLATDGVCKMFSPENIVKAMSRRSIIFLYRNRDGDAGRIVKELRTKHYTNLGRELNAALDDAFIKTLNANEAATGQADRPAKTVKQRNVTKNDQTVRQSEVSPNEEESAAAN